MRDGERKTMAERAREAETDARWLKRDDGKVEKVDETGVNWIKEERRKSAC